MKHRVIIEFDEGGKNEPEEKGKESPRKGQKDVWDFEGLRSTLWGDAPFGKMPRDVFHLGEIRKTLWGR